MRAVELGMTRRTTTLPPVGAGGGPRRGRRSRRARDSVRERVSLVVADLYPAARAGVRAAVEPYGFDVVAEAGDAAEAVAVARRERPRLCVVAADLPGGGIDAVRRIAGALPGTAVVVLGDASSSDDLVAAVEAGAVGFLPRLAAPARLPDALNSALDGYVSVPVHMLAEAVRDASASAVTAAMPGVPGVRLTRREQQVLRGLMVQTPTAEIATKLGISPVTVRRYVSEILRKAGVSGRAELRALLGQGNGD
jgi:DNA-binding NarL/FixJ family response regulator